MIVTLQFLSYKLKNIWWNILTNHDNVHSKKFLQKDANSTDSCYTYELGEKWFVDCHPVVPVCIITHEEGPCLFLTE